MKTSMDELERTLETARRRADPLAADRARISERLERELGADVVLGPSRAPSPAPIVAARGGSLAAIVGTAVVTGVLGFVLGYGMGLGERSELARAPEGPAQAVASAASTSASTEPAPGESAAPRVAAPRVATPIESAAPPMVVMPAAGEASAPAMATTPAPGDPPAPASQLAKPPHGPARARAHAPVAQLEFAEVVERLRRANRALGDGKPLLTRLELDQLDRLDADTLREERDMTRLLCACALGDVDAATRQARRLLGSSAGSIYAPRIEQSCAGTAATAR